MERNKKLLTVHSVEHLLNLNDNSYDHVIIQCSQTKVLKAILAELSLIKHHFIGQLEIHWLPKFDSTTIVDIDLSNFNELVFNGGVIKIANSLLPNKLTIKSFIQNLEVIPFDWLDKKTAFNVKSVQLDHASSMPDCISFMTLDDYENLEFVIINSGVDADVVEHNLEYYISPVDYHIFKKKSEMDRHPFKGILIK